MSQVNEIVSAIDNQILAFDKFKKANIEKVEALEAANTGLQSRVEELESRAKSPGKTGSKADAPLADVKTFVTKGGAVIHEFGPTTRMQDVIVEKAAPVSLARWLGATMCGERCEDKDALEYARSQKQLLTSTSGILIPQEFQPLWIDLIRSQMVLNSAGMRTTTMLDRTQVHSAVVSDPAVTWHAENGAISVGNPTFQERKLTAKTAVVRCTGSVEVAQDCADFGQQLLNTMVKAMASAVDRAGLVGTGSDMPTGLVTTSGVGSIPTVGTPTNYSQLVSAVMLLLTAGIPLDVATKVAIMSPGIWSVYEGLASGIASDKTQLQRPQSLRNTNFLVTTALPTGTTSPSVPSSIILGDFSDLLLGMRREAAVESLKLTDFATNLLVEYIGYIRCDFLVLRPSSFVVVGGVTGA